jgi:hypothetical protein
MNNTSFLDSISDKRLPTLSTEGTKNRSHVTNRDARSNSMPFSSPLVISQKIQASMNLKLSHTNTHSYVDNLS